MTDDDPQTHRIAELEREVEALRLRLPSNTTRTSGRFVVFLAGGLLVLAFATALSLWTAAKRTPAARAAATPPRPAATRVDAAGHAVGRGIDQCLEEHPLALPVSVVTRVKLTPTGALLLLDAKLTPLDDEVMPCLRKIPLGLKLAAGEGTGDVEVRCDVTREPDGSRATKIAWTERAPAPAFAN